MYQGFVRKYYATSALPIFTMHLFLDGDYEGCIIVENINWLRFPGSGDIVGCSSQYVGVYKPFCGVES